MKFLKTLSLTRPQRYVIYAVSLGNILEWYEIYLYVFWSPVIGHLFFSHSHETSNLISALSLFTLGFFIRPLGGLFFGRLGDRIGRKKAFILSILTMTIPTFLLGILPTYSQIGIFAPVCLALLRIMQTFPAGGELPGAFCYLYENADAGNRKFMSSFGAVGNQIGILLSASECFLLKALLPEEMFHQIGWRISFIVGGVIGLCGLFLRYQLHETKLFQEMVAHHPQFTQTPLLKVIRGNSGKIGRGIFYGVIDTVAFYLLSILFPIYFSRIWGTDESQNLLITIFLLALTTIPLPFFGLLGEYVSIKKLMIGSCIGILVLLYPISQSMQQPTLLFTGSVATLFILCITCITALLPYALSNLFPTSVRYTCMGLSFNIADGIIGGLSPLIALLLVRHTGDPGSLGWILFVACLFSLGSYLRMKDG